MKRIFTILLISIASTAMVSAQTSGKSQVKQPTNVIKQLNNLIDTWGKKDSQSYSVSRNPNTNLIESSERIVHFRAPKNESILNGIRDAFTADEPISYQFQHTSPNTPGSYSLDFVTNNGTATTKRWFTVRDDNYQEMWLMCTKNPTNPQLRDAYAIVWKTIHFTPIPNDSVDGKIFLLTSLRPDIYTSMAVTSSNTFKIEGRVDAEITDSLYNIYIADTYEQLNALADDDYVACVPVVNKRFEYSVDLDRPKVGRLRCIFPDGSLCSAWIDIDFVPGETYRITVHNGYYEGDMDYERRVGRSSGKSLINRISEHDLTANGDVSMDNFAELNYADYYSENINKLTQDPDFVTYSDLMSQDGNAISKLFEEIQPSPNISVIVSDMKLKSIIDKNASFEKNLAKVLKIMEEYGDQKILLGFNAELMKFYAQQINACHAIHYTKNTATLRKCQDSIMKTMEKNNKRIKKILKHTSSL